MAPSMSCPLHSACHCASCNQSSYYSFCVVVLSPHSVMSHVVLMYRIIIILSPPLLPPTQFLFALFSPSLSMKQFIFSFLWDSTTVHTLNGQLFSVTKWLAPQKNYLVSFTGSRNKFNNSIPLFRFFGIPMSILPKIRSSAEIYGYLAEGSLQGVPISGVRIIFHFI